MSNGSVSVAKVAQVLNLKNFTPDINLKKCKIISSDVNRPALQLTGYFEHFEESRIQMIGNVEYTFIQQMSDADHRNRVCYPKKIMKRKTTLQLQRIASPKLRL